MKCDGWRIQLHEHGDSVVAFTKNGHDDSSRVRWMVDALVCLKSSTSQPRGDLAELADLVLDGLCICVHSQIQCSPLHLP
jgi:ATP-dependent DNA ligase